MLPYIEKAENASEADSGKHPSPTIRHILWAMRSDIIYIFGVIVVVYVTTMYTLQTSFAYYGNLLVSRDRNRERGWLEYWYSQAAYVSSYIIFSNSVAPVVEVIVLAFRLAWVTYHDVSEPFCSLIAALRKINSLREREMREKEKKISLALKNHIIIHKWNRSMRTLKKKMEVRCDYLICK